MALKRQYAIRVVYLSNIVIAVSYRGGRYQKYVEENVSFLKLCCLLFCKNTAVKFLG